jgi:homoserine kinase
VRIDDILGDGRRLPRDAAKNTAGIAALALLTALGERRGVALTISKGLPLPEWSRGQCGERGGGGGRG